MKRKYFIIFIAFISLIIFFGLEKINLHTADLGRHIINGKILLNKIDGLEKKDVLFKNTFSSNFSDFPFTNHHFLSGILFYLIYITFGFKGLSIFYILSIIFSGLMILYLIKDKVKSRSILLSILFLTPIIANRLEVRPEGISFIFLVIFFYILQSVTKYQKNEKMLYVLPIISLLWINSHIYFVFGFLLLAIFFLENIIRKNYNLAKKILQVSFLSVFISIFNPHHLNGLIYPFKIFQNYGYKIVENQSISFLENINFSQPIFIWYKISILIIIGYIIYSIFKKRFDFSLSLIIVFFAIMGFLSIRYIPLFGFFALIPFSYLFDDVLNKTDEIDFDLSVISYFILLATIISVLFINFQKNLPWNRNFGVGLTKNGLALGSFIKQNDISGPIFNNYDIGSYLIFSLFPKEKVFVDNRPEAYPESFFQNQYIPMQENKDIFEKIDKENDFNSIIFYRLDYTPWAQKFLINTIDNINYTPVYVDEYSIIFLKKNEKNKILIEKYKIDKSFFVIK